MQTELELQDDNTPNKNFNIVSRNILNDLEKNDRIEVDVINRPKFEI